MPREEYFSKALYTFDIGQNDLGAGFFGNMSVEEVNESIPDIINKFSANVKVFWPVTKAKFMTIHGMLQFKVQQLRSLITVHLGLGILILLLLCIKGKKREHLNS